jgi:hypothetical protein
MSAAHAGGDGSPGQCVCQRVARCSPRGRGRFAVSSAPQYRAELKPTRAGTVRCSAIWSGSAASAASAAHDRRTRLERGRFVRTTIFSRRCGLQPMTGVHVSGGEGSVSETFDWMCASCSPRGRGRFDELLLQELTDHPCSPRQAYTSRAGKVRRDHAATSCICAAAHDRRTRLGRGRFVSQHAFETSQILQPLWAGTVRSLRFTSSTSAGLRSGRGRFGFSRQQVGEQRACSPHA